MMEYKSLGAVSLPNFKHRGEDEKKKKNKKVTECMFTTVPVGCMYIPYLMPLEKKSKMTFQLSYVKRSRAYESLELYTT